MADIFDCLWKDVSEVLLAANAAKGPLLNSVSKLNLFLASLLVIGLVTHPEILDYFMLDPEGIFGNEWMKLHFTAHIWHFIKANISVPAQSIVELIRSNAKDMWNPSQHLVVDEMMIPFTGKWRYRQYVKGKPHNTGMQTLLLKATDAIGIKVYGLADSENFLFDFFFVGESPLNPTQPKQIVIKFIDDLIEIYGPRQWVIVADSFYSSLDLAKLLHQRNVLFILSCQANRPSWLYSQFLHIQLTKGCSKEAHNRSFSAISYYDKAKVNLVTNYFQAGKMVSIPGTNKQLPEGILKYRQQLGNLDRFDRLLHLYLAGTRHIKWTGALLVGCLKIVVNNTYIIAKRLKLTNSLKDTMRQVIMHLSKGFTFRSKGLLGRNPEKSAGGDHFPKKEVMPKLCAQCKKNGRRSNTKYICPTCNSYLHPECFRNYHQ